MMNFPFYRGNSSCGERERSIGSIHSKACQFSNIPVMGIIRIVHDGGLKNSRLF